MQKFAEYDRDNLQKTISSLNQINADMTTNNAYDKILDTKIKRSPRKYVDFIKER